MLPAWCSVARSHAPVDRLTGAARHACREHHQLEGREQEVRQAIERAYQAALLRHQAAAVDERAETHVQAWGLLVESSPRVPWPSTWLQM